MKDSTGIAEAVRMVGLNRRKPTQHDAPAPSTFPMTSAARSAMRKKQGGQSRLDTGPRGA